MQGNFVLDLHDLDAAGKSFSTELPIDWLTTALAGTQAEPAGEPGAVEVRYSRTGNDVVVHGRVTAALHMPCVRCLEPVSVKIDADLSLLLVPAKTDALRSKDTTKAKKRSGKAQGDDEDLPNDLLDVETYEGEKVVLDPYVRDALLLEAPPFPLCSEDCAGIAPPPPSEGAGEEDIDPRLAPLRSLASRIKSPSLTSLF